MFDLQPDEEIVSVYGRSSYRMNALWFETNQGRVYGLAGGRDEGNFWSADPPTALNAHLGYISGYQGASNLNGLTLHWQYTELA
ncbi:hypothetical protein [Hymenobacter sp. BRD67]|uniref:hypothetical protein n=1 Tax=Hymenobacter sp. BRD67 TaxID=2675877 RepID=UPI001565AB18|nr:hypothetical protein [Hymenobacter sp. BRD67]QKG53666.1 hypothetical protein GKZ67_14970 [Hymenobacter sp. BRD67]